MSEEKVIKHTEKAIHLLKDKESKVKEKITGFIEEIVVIIIAVSITLAFHNWNDARQERKIEREFLTGLKEDLKQNAAGLEESIKRYQPTIDYYNQVWKQINTNKPDPQYMDSLSGYLRNTSYFVFDDSRFEGFKSSGYLRLIENEKLLQHILILYSVDMPFEKAADINVFHTREQDYSTYIGLKCDVDANGNHIVSKLFNDRAFRYQISRYVEEFDERKRHKQHVVKRTLDLVKEIEDELNKQ